jgi:multicomponent Na+:H+ antiporter subunit D
MIELLPLFIAIPLGGAFLITLTAWKLKRLADILGICAGLPLLILAVLCIGKQGVYHVGAFLAPLGINLVLDGFSAILLVIVNVVGFLALLYSVSYMEQYTSKHKYYALFLLMIGGMNGVVLTGDMFNLFVFLEIASIASYALVAFGCEHEELEASFKYLVLGSIGSTFILLGVAVLYGLTGFLNMASIAQAVASGVSASAGTISHTWLFSLASVLFLVGFGIKAALVPFHPWLPDAHPSAPAPISAMLSGVLIKALGVYAITRVVFNVLGTTPLFGIIIMVLGVLSMTIGVFLAVGQWDFKRLLAYHSISQMGYVVLGIGLGMFIVANNGPALVAGMAIFGGLFHLANHAVFKSLLFLCSGSVEYQTGTRQLKELGGLQEKMPVTRVTCTVASLSIAGIPPFNGFWSKLIIVIATVQAAIIFPGMLILTAVTILVSFVTLISFLKVLRYVFLGELPSLFKKIKDSPFFMGVSLVILALLCICMGLLVIPGLRSVVFDPAVEALKQGLSYGEKILTGL